MAIGRTGAGRPRSRGGGALRGGRSLGAVAVALLLGALASPGLALGLVRFEVPRTLSDAGFLSDRPTTDPRIAIDASGRATVVWRRGNPFGSSEYVQAVQLSATDGAPGTVFTLSDGVGDVHPRVAADSLNRARVVWGGGFDSRIKWATIGAGGSPGPEEILTDFGTRPPKIVIDSSNRATLVWVDGDAPESIQVYQVRHGGRLQTLAQVGSVVDPKVAVDSSGHVTVVWSEDDGTLSRVYSRRVRADGTLEPLRTLSGANDAYYPDVAVDSSGRATVVYQANPFDDPTIQARRLRADGTPDVVVHTLSEPDDIFINPPTVALDSSGRATVAWFRHGPSLGDAVIRTMRLGAQGHREPVRTIPTLGSVNLDTARPLLVVDSSGRAMFVWSVLGTGDLRFVRLGADRTLEPTQTLATKAGVPQFGIDPAGRPTVVWWQASKIVSARATLVGPGALIGAGPAEGATIGGGPVAFSFESDPPGAADRFECVVDGGAPFACGSPVSIGPLPAGAHSFGVRAFDGDGGGAPARRAFNVTAGGTPRPPLAGGTPRPPLAAGTPRPPLADTTAPVLSRLTLSRTRFRVGRRRTPTAVTSKRRRRRASVGTRIRYRLSEAARVVFAIQRGRRGRRVRVRGRRRCVPPTRRLVRRGARKCTRYRTARRLRRSGRPGANRFAFSGRIGRRALRPGRYRIVARAIDPAGNRSRAARRGFRIVRHR